MVSEPVPQTNHSELLILDSLDLRPFCTSKTVHRVVYACKFIFELEIFC